MTQLRVCDGCTRHVFASEQACPFCGAALSAAPKRTFGERLRKGMSRAQILAVAAAVGGVSGPVLGACSDTPNNDGRAGASGTTAGTESGGSGGSSGTTGGAGAGGSGSGGTAGTVSGGAGGTTGGAGGVTGGAGGMTGGDAGFGQPVYGAPFPDDAGADASDSTDASTDEGGMAIPLYGAAPVPR
jgi:hypothetical protein